jgi:AraC-like DNA-binding protein
LWLFVVTETVNWAVGLISTVFFRFSLNPGRKFLVLNTTIGNWATWLQPSGATFAQTTHQHIHNKLIEKAREALAGTSLSVSEIANQLGFDYPQSFSKLFKNKTQVSPLASRNKFEA